MAPDRRKRPITTPEAGSGERGLWHGRVSGVVNVLAKSVYDLFAHELKQGYPLNLSI